MALKKGDYAVDREGKLIRILLVGMGDCSIVQFQDGELYNLPHGYIKRAEDPVLFLATGERQKQIDTILSKNIWPDLVSEIKRRGGGLDG